MAKENKHVAVQDDLAQKALSLKADAQQRAKELADLGVDAKDLIIPSIQIMQGTSELVGESKAKLGDVLNMQTEELLGDFNKKFHFLPLKLFKTLRTYDVTNSGFKFMHEEPLTSENDKLQGEGMINGTPVKRYQTLNYFVLLKTDLDKNEAFPCLMRFRSTGAQAGRSLATYLYKLVFFRKKPYSNFVAYGVERKKKDTATYAVPVIDTKSTIAATPAEMAEAENWLSMLASANYKLDEREETSDEDRVAAAKPVIVDSDVVGEATDY